MESYNMNARRVINDIVFYLTLAVMLFIILFPIYITVSTSFKFQKDAFSVPPKWLFIPTMTNFKAVFLNEAFAKGIFNSFTISFITTILTLFCATTAAYSFTRFKFKGSNKITSSILITRMIPNIVLALPLYVLGQKLGTIDTYPLMLAAMVTFALPFQIWLLLGFFAQIPRSLDESALVDGCNWYTAFYKIVCPSALPGIAASAILTFIYSWNDFFFALVLTRKNLKTAPLATMDFIAFDVFNWGATMAACTILILPTLIIGFSMQRYIIKGLTAGAVKG